MSSLLRLEQQKKKKDFLKSILNSHMSPSFLLAPTHLEMKRQIPPLTTDTPVVPLKTLFQTKMG